ncbi:GrBNV gp97-like protein [Tomelloso virus]|uniref:GrBNV gp97-like protein n=1 Tax=Tomelloso virus TaxID=2053981 RepID=A0A2H4T2T5_9VIRU|nr:GrBNV gp97-like protein [Tomelloso virus]ATY70244.1 GrBNV gp97-like protein [Tomelloso virus]
MSFFDETIFTFGESFSDFTRVNVYNDADAYLVKRQGIEYGQDCLPRTNEKIANLNPRSVCAGTNMYSMDPTNKPIKKMVNFNQINVYNGETTMPMKIGEHQPGQIYTVGQLTSFESAIMLKYYAVNNSDVYITNHLHSFVSKHFIDHRAWFNHLPIGIVQNHKKELILNGDIVNVPILSFASDPVEF